MRYQVSYVVRIDLDAKDETEAYAFAAEAVKCFDLTQDIDAVIGCGDVGDAHAYVGEHPITIAHLDGV